MAKIAHYFTTKANRKPFLDWYCGLVDTGQYKVNALIDKAKLGIGKIETISGTSGLFEIKDLSKGPGFRVYFGNDHSMIILLLFGGTKNTQRTDIRISKKYWKEHRLNTKTKT